ncbi:hypothetical protein DYB28_001635 [Aphanomyces astaci]|uniref:Uncharacterized protein n=1 Tax=Aphanomyces astaci TaxID=112090 RepID=A0A9X8DLH8_APHAT|nr:hypothetical protein DYB28_001635 [Aphanomyces astaci]
MKFLAALVHAAVAASSQAGADPLALVFDSLAHRDAEGQPIFLSQNLGVQFCSPPVAEGCDTASGSGDIDCPTGLKLECINFTVLTMHLPTNASIWLQDLYPLSKPNTTYSFTVFSNGETLDESPISLEGAKAFTTTNDPNTDVRLAYTYYPGK